MDAGNIVSASRGRARREGGGANTRLHLSDGGTQWREREREGNEEERKEMTRVKGSEGESESRTAAHPRALRGWIEICAN